MPMNFVPAEQRFQVMFEQAAVGILQTDMAYRFVLANQFVCDMLGYSLEELLQKTVIDVTYPDDRPKTTGGRKRLLAGEISSNTTEKRYQHRDGHYVWVRVTASLLHGADGTPLGFLTIVEDISQRKTTEEALRTAQAQHQMLFDTTNVGVVYLNPQGEALAVNAAAHRILGLTAQQVRERTALDPRWQSIHEDGTPFPDAEHPTVMALATGQPVTGVVMGVRQAATGAYRWLSVSAVPQFQPGETKPQMVYATFEDITERQQLEQRTHAALSALLQMAHLLVAEEHVEESSANTHHFLEIARNVLGCTRTGLVQIEPGTERLQVKALMGTEVAGIHARWQARVARHANKRYLTREQFAALRRGELVHYTNSQAILRSPLPEVKRSLFAPILIHGTLIGYIFFDFDRPTHVYSPHENSLALAVANLSALMMEQESLGSERRHQAARTHEALAALLSMAEVLADPHAPDTTASEDAEPTPHAMTQRLARLIQTVLGCRRVLIDTQAPTDMVCLPILMGEQQIGYLGLEHADPTHIFTEEELALARATARLAGVVLERDRLHREWATARANELALREANRRMDAFLSLASHEIRTPLTHFKGGVQLAQRRITRMLTTKAGDAVMLTRQQLVDLHDLLALTDRQTNRMNRLVSDLLDGARVPLGQLAIQLEPCDLAVIMREAITSLMLGAPQRQITVEMPPLPIMVWADAERIEQVLLNYLTNALKYTPASSPIAVRLSVDGTQAHVVVSDSGPGIATTDQPHIWERFYRVQGTEVTNGSDIGLGLGLFLAHALITSHHGQVGVESTEGAGASFWFTLPLLPDQGNA